MHKRKINIIINRPRTGSQNLFLMTTINEISNPDESYMGTLNLQFREYPIDDDEKVETYCRESDAFEQYVIEFINSHWDEHHPLKELNHNSHFITCQTPMEILSRYISMMNPFSLSYYYDRAILTKSSGRHSKHLPEPPYL